MSLIPTPSFLTLLLAGWVIGWELAAMTVMTFADYLCLERGMHVC